MYQPPQWNEITFQLNPLYNDTFALCFSFMLIKKLIREKILQFDFSFTSFFFFALALSVKVGKVNPLKVSKWQKKAF